MSWGGGGFLGELGRGIKAFLVSWGGELRLLGRGRLSWCAGEGKGEGVGRGN